jgi:ABC-type branched-subunit amino acid transport system substrate-binding protein
VIAARPTAGLVVALLLVVLAACSSGAGPKASPAREPLRIGTLIPHTGAMSQFGPAEQAGVTLAVHDVNQAGGVLGQPISVIDGDSGDIYSDLASQSVDNELAAKVQAIVGATGSSVSLTVIDKIVGAGVVEISPADASTTFATYPDHGLYFRLVPDDSLEAKVLSAQLQQAGQRSVAIVSVRDPYGQGYAAELAADVKAWHGNPVQIQYDGRTQSFGGVVQQVASAGVQAVVLIGFAETAKIAGALAKAGLGPAAVPLYVSDLALSNVLAGSLPAGTMAGAVGIRAGGPLDPAFVSRLQAESSKLQDFGYAAQAYDSVILLALAADRAGRTDGSAIAAELPAITRGTQTCTSYAACSALLKNGASIAYAGASGPLPLRSDGDLVSGTVGVYRYGPSGTYPVQADQYIAVTTPAAKR